MGPGAPAALFHLRPGSPRAQGLRGCEAPSPEDSGVPGRCHCPIPLVWGARCPSTGCRGPPSSSRALLGPGATRPEPHDILISIFSCFGEKKKLFVFAWGPCFDNQRQTSALPCFLIFLKLRIGSWETRA